MKTSAMALYQPYAVLLGACLSFQLRLCPLVDLRGEFLLEVGAQEAVEEEPSRSI